MRIVYLIPHRALTEQSQWQELNALADEYEVIPIFAPKAGAAGIVWLSTVGVRKAIRDRPDIIVARDLDSLGGAWKVKRATGAKLVYDMHDPYSMMVEGDVPATILRIADFRERGLLRRVDLALASDGARMDWLRWQGYRGKSEIVMNCRNPLPYKPPPGTNMLYYAGTLHRSRFIREMVDAMSFLPTARLTIAGLRTPNSEYDWLKGKYGVGPEGAFGDEPVVFLGKLNSVQSLELLQQSDISIQMADPSMCINRLGPYSRLFDAMAVGRAAIGTKGTANGDLIVENQMGMAVDYDIESFVWGINTLLKYDLSVPGFNAWNASRRKYNWATESKKLVGVFQSL